MISYERQFDILLDMAEQLTDVFQQHGRELKDMKALNDKMRAKLEEMGEDVEDEEESDLDDEELEEENDEQGDEDEEGDGEEQNDDDSSSDTHRGPFEKRPPGGYADKKAAKDLEDELDGPSDKRDRQHGHDRSGSRAHSTPVEEEDSDSSESSRGPFQKRSPGGPGDEATEREEERELDDESGSSASRPEGSRSAGHKPRPLHDHTPDKREHAEMDAADEEAKAKEEMFFG